ncbi:ATPase [Penicillium alfredii]|uniref:ATPase n=1 Tax=Penicillium alfredii TaxID=1506179 RepID=A0A9W9F1G4_9EURO|nr:ATPase [Penicillium alfredii]KAJ5091824.1 ATPase [Penicillium alfredii]
MSLESPTYLSSLQNNIRARPIPWDGAVRAGNITEDHLKKIKAVDKVRKDQRRQTIEADLAGYTSLLAGGEQGKSVLDSAARRTDIVQYILVLASDLIQDVPSLADSLVSHPEPYKPFLPFLHHSTNAEDPIPLLTSTFLTALVSHSLFLSSKPAARDEEALPQLYTYLSTLTKNQDSGLQDIGVQGFSELLRKAQSRKIFWTQRQETLEPLIETLRAAAGTKENGTSGSSTRTIEPGLAGGVGLQLLYRVLLVVWQLTFESALVGEELQESYEIVQLYTQLLRLSPKEKTTRLLIATLYNLCSSNRTALLPVAVFVRLPALLTNLGGRHLTDPDLLEDLNTLSTMLDEYTKTQTTFDEYAAELQSGHLRWSPPHKNPTFWKDNARRILDEANGALPKKLAEILSKNWDNDKQVLAIACNDVGHLVKELPERRTQMERLGLKTRVMELMADQDEAVRWESLRAVGEWMRGCVSPKFATRRLETWRSSGSPQEFFTNLENRVPHVEIVHRLQEIGEGGHSRDRGLEPASGLEACKDWVRIEEKNSTDMARVMESLIVAEYSPGEFIYTTKSASAESDLTLTQPVDPFSSLSSDQRALLHHFINDASQITACHSGMQQDICRMLVPMALQTPSLLYATTALSAIHLQALQNQSESVKSAPDIARLMALSLEHFRTELQNPSTKGSEALVATARTLCLAEIHSGAIHPNSWRAHIEGARALMKAADAAGEGSSLQSAGGFRPYLDRWYWSIVSLTALTGNGPPIGDISDSALFGPVDQGDSPDYLDDYWGFTVDLAAVFRQIGAAAWRNHQAEAQGFVEGEIDSNVEDEAACLELSIQQLMDRGAKSQPSLYPGVAEGLSAESVQQLALCNEAFQHSALIQIHRRLRKTPTRSPDVQQSVQRILDCATQIGPSSGLSPWVILTTPLFIAGCEARGDDRDTVRHLLASLHDTIRVPNVLQSLKFLEQYWANQLTEDEDWSHFLDRMRFDFIPY